MSNKKVPCVFCKRQIAVNESVPLMKGKGTVREVVHSCVTHENVMNEAKDIIVGGFWPIVSGGQTFHPKVMALVEEMKPKEEVKAV